MPVTEQRPITGIVETLRALPGEWDDRRGEEFDRLSSDERAAIQRKRLYHLATVGLSIITAILDHGWRPSNRCLELVESAHRARRLERTKPYEQGAIKFLGMFVKWYREHPDQLPPDAPVLGPLNLHLSSFRREDVPREDFTKTCEAIAWLMSGTPAPRVEEAEVWSAPAGFVGRKTICYDQRFRKQGKNPAPTTIDAWVKSAEQKGAPIKIEKDPANSENHYPEDWIMGRIAVWSPRSPKRNTPT